MRRILDFLSDQWPLLVGVFVFWVCVGFIGWAVQGWEADQEQYNRDQTNPAKCRDMIPRESYGCAHSIHKLVVEDSVAICRCQRDVRN